MTGICRHQHQHLAVRRKARCHLLSGATSAAQQVLLQQNYSVCMPRNDMQLTVMSPAHAVS
jgi:hypothetical protein